MPPTMQQDAKKTHHKHSTSMVNLPSEAKIVTIGFAAIPVITHSEKNVACKFNTKPTHQENSGRRSPQKLPSEAGRTSRFGTSRNQLSNASQPRLGPFLNQPDNFTDSRTPDPYLQNHHYFQNQHNFQNQDSFSEARKTLPATRFNPPERPTRDIERPDQRHAISNFQQVQTSGACGGGTGRASQKSGISSQVNMTARKKPKKSALKTHKILFGEENLRSYSKMDSFMAQGQTPRARKNERQTSWVRQTT